MRRIFYFNITYGCNSNCIFCYSHNTWHNSMPHKEISLEVFIDYLEGNHISAEDRVILNGGEPLLHARIIEFLEYLKRYRCETLIYTNGRLLSEIDLSKLDFNFRFIVPIHGYSELHDSITGVKGSYLETINGMFRFKEKNDCLLDLKVILNNGMIKNDDTLNRTLESLNNIYFNNAVHLTKMADTIISSKHNCSSISNNTADYYMKILFEYFVDRGCRIKLFDTCIKSFSWLKNYELMKFQDKITVYFKDYNQERQIFPNRLKLGCMNTCKNKKYCISAVSEYTVLEFNDNKLYENLE